MEDDTNKCVVDPEELALPRTTTPLALSRTPTPSKPGARAIEITLDVNNVEDIAKFFEHMSKLLRLRGHIKITIE